MIMLTVKDVCKIYNITKRSVYNWIKEGLPYKQEKVIGKKTYMIIDQNDIDKFHSANRKQIEESNEGCFYCRGIEGHRIISCNHFKDIAGIRIRNIDTPYNYCPNCGRKLRRENE